MPVKISQLPTASLVTPDDFFPIVDSGSLTTQRTTAQQVLNFVTGSTFDTLSVTLLTGTTITGSTALFTSVTASHAGSGAGLTNIPNSATTATSANTANAIVARDASGNFSAGTITAALSGNATTVTNGVYTTTISSHATTGVTAGNGLTGGGTVGTLTLDVGAGDGISVTADTVAVDSTVLRTTTAQSISGPKTFTDYITGSITGSDAKFTSVTASHAGSGAGLTNIPNASLVNSSVTVGSTSISLGSSSTIITGLTQVTSSEIFVSGDLKVNGTASIAQLNTLNQTSLVVGDKYITILSGGVDHTGINGAGFLWGTSSGPGETTGALGEHAHILYDASRDALKIFPGLYVSGTTTVDGNVGIGTNSPQQALDVVGSIRLSTGDIYRPDNSGIALEVGNGTNSYFGTHLFRDSVGTNERMRITDGGNVGIGTNSPQVKTEIVKGTQIISRSAANTVLFVSDNSTSQTYLEIANTSSGEAGLLFGKGSSTGNYGLVNYNNSVDQMQFYTAAGQRMVIDSVGNVGIGTNNPGARLDVDSAANAWARWRASTTSGSFMSFVKGGTSTNIGYIGTDAGGIINGGVGNNFGIRSEYDLLLMAGSAERARITSAGNVGIGTNSPATKLDVNGEINLANGNSLTWGGVYTDGNPTIAGSSAGASSAIIFYPRGNVSGEQARITADGKVGIGTTSPQYKLTVGDPTTGLNVDHIADSPNGVALRFGDASGWKFHIARARETGGGPYNTGTTGSLMTFQDNGNIGIGTTSPATKLDVSGSIRVTGGSIYGQVAEITASVSTTYTLQSSDSGKFLTINNGSPVTLTVPSGLPTGFTVSICQLGAGQITVSPSGVTINNRQSHTKAAGQHAVISIVGTAADTYVLVGDTAL